MNVIDEFVDRDDPEIQRVGPDSTKEFDQAATTQGTNLVLYDPILI